jgi:hypothetical protein
VGKARSLLYSGEPERGFTWVSASLKTRTRLEKYTND